MTSQTVVQCPFIEAVDASIETFDIRHVRAIDWAPGQQFCTVTYELPAPLKHEVAVSVELSMAEMEMLVPTCERLLHVANVIAEHASESRRRQLAFLLRGWAEQSHYRHANHGFMGNFYQGSSSVVSWNDIKKFHFVPRPPGSHPTQAHHCWVEWSRGAERIDLRLLEANCSGFTAMASALCRDNARSGTEAFGLIRMLAMNIPFAVMARNAERFASQISTYAQLLPDQEVYALMIAGIDVESTAAVDLPALDPAL